MVINVVFGVNVMVGNNVLLLFEIVFDNWVENGSVFDKYRLVMRICGL